MRPSSLTLLTPLLDPSFQVNGGSWALTDCTVVSSRGGRGGAKPQRASTAISLRHGASLQLSGCEVRDARTPRQSAPRQSISGRPLAPLMMMRPSARSL